MRYALIGITVLMLGGTAYSQSFTSSEYCDPVCLLGAGRDNGFYDCSYHTYAQCYASRSGVGGTCVDNPMLSYCKRAPAAHSPRHRTHK
jgi:hypothetical protein